MIAIANTGGYNEIRAQYAGFFLAIAVVCGASLAGVVSRQAAFVVLAVVFGGLIAGRLASFALDGGAAGYGRTLVLMEIGGTAGRRPRAVGPFPRPGRKLERKGMRPKSRLGHDPAGR